jgi:hypothetical protein
MKTKLAFLLAALAATSFAQAGDQDCYITEKMYTGLFGEFVEVTNTGAASVDVNGWVYDDNSASFGSGTVLFTSSTVLDQNECFIITEVSDTVFRQAWYTDSGEGTPAGLVAVYQNNSNNLGRSDEINIYENGGTLVDKLTFNDQASSGSDAKGPRTEDVSAVPGPLTVLGDNKFKNWVLSVAGTGNAWKAGAAAPVPGPAGSPGQYPN